MGRSCGEDVAKPLLPEILVRGEYPELVVQVESVHVRGGVGVHHRRTCIRPPEWSGDACAGGVAEDEGTVLENHVRQVEISRVATGVVGEA